MVNKDLLISSFERVEKHIDSNDDDSFPVVKFRTPAELSEIFNFPVEEEGDSHSEFTDYIEKYPEYSVRTGNKVPEPVIFRL